MKRTVRYHRKRSKLLKFVSGLLLLFLCSLTSEGKGRSSGGKTVAKSALSGLSKLNLGVSEGIQIPNGGRAGDSYHSTLAKSALYNLTRHILQGYDKGVRPVLKNSDVITVEVDVLYRQVLDMDEKNQVLTSLVWYRQHWTDAFLKWDPILYNNITQTWLSSDSVWMPDIVLQEETGTKDYSPRLPFVKVGHHGHVEYHEPVTFTTSCSMNTMHFPFDVQHCPLTFSSWSYPGSKLILKPERTNDQLQHNLHFFINTGEWLLEEINVRKTEANYSEMVVESAGDYSNWPQVLFVVTLRRNSSFYVQSMIFPSVLLTSIALLGFLLPPDSGERVGLQITILLTFMVFLLTVCEMFPASTGPYLGMYYVICTFLLAVNLAMTVVVLRLYYHPNKPISKKLKYFTYMAGRLFCVDVSDITSMTTNSNRSIPDSYSKCPDILTSLQKAHSKKLHRCLSGMCCISCGDNNTTEKLADVETITKKNKLYACPPTPHFDRRKSCYRTEARGINQFDRQEKQNENIHKRKRLPEELCQADEVELLNEKNVSFPQASSLDQNQLKLINSKLSDIAEMFKYITADISLKNKDVENENEWKSIALVMDRLFLRLYFAILLISHISIVTIAFVTA